MGLFDWFKRKQEEVVPEEARGVVLLGHAAEDPEWTRSAPSDLTPRSGTDQSSLFSEYLSLYGSGDSMLYSVVSAIAGDVSRIALRPVNQRTKEIADPRSVNAALHNPNPEQSLAQLTEVLVMDALLTGNAFAALDTSNELFRLPVDRIVIHLDSLGHVSRYGLKDATGTSEQSIKKENMVHIKLPNPANSVWGTGPTNGARRVLLINDSEMRYLLTFYAHGARPSGFISFAADVDPESAQRAVSDFKTKFARRAAHGQLVSLTGGAKYEAMSVTPVDGGVIETRKLTDQSLMSIFGIPAFRLMNMENADYANASAQQKVYDLKTVLPWAHRISDSLNNNKLLVPMPELVKMEPDEQPILNLHRDEAKIASAASIYVSAGLLSRDRIRERFLGEGPLDPSVPQFGPITTPQADEELIVDVQVVEEDTGRAVKSLTGSSRKLSVDDVQELRALYSDHGITQVQLSERYQVSQKTISRILKRQSYKDVV